MRFFTGDPKYVDAKEQELRRFSGALPPEFEAAREDLNVRYHQRAPVWGPVLNLDEILAEDDLDEAERNSRREQREKEREQQRAALGWLKELFDVLPDPSPGAIDSEGAEGPRSFDPSRDSAADAIMSAENFFDQRQEDDWGLLQGLDRVFGRRGFRLDTQSQRLRLEGN